MNVFFVYISDYCIHWLVKMKRISYSKLGSKFIIRWHEHCGHKLSLLVHCIYGYFYKFPKKGIHLGPFHWGRSFRHKLKRRDLTAHLTVSNLQYIPHNFHGGGEYNQNFLVPYSVNLIPLTAPLLFREQLASFFIKFMWKKSLYTSEAFVILN